MPLPNYISLANTFGQWLNATNNLTSHVDNTDVYILASQNATPRVTTGNVSINGTATVVTLASTNSVSVSGTVTLDGSWPTFTGGWSVDSGVLTHNAASGTIVYDIAPIVGETYTFTFTVVYDTPGALLFNNLNDSDVYIPEANGTYTYTYTAQSGGGSILFRAGTDVDVSISDIVITRTNRVAVTATNGSAQLAFSQNMTRSGGTMTELFSGEYGYIEWTGNSKTASMGVSNRASAIAGTFGNAETSNPFFGLSVHKEDTNEADFFIELDGNSGNATPDTTITTPGKLLIPSLAAPSGQTYMLVIDDQGVISAQPIP